MKPTNRTVLSLLFLSGLTGSVLATCLQQEAMAARNASGTYALPAGNPVTTKTTITSSWANTTLSDIATELTNSLDRSGRGAMTAPLQLSSGTVSAPGLTFSAEPASGLYRAGTGDLRLSVASTDVEKYAASGVTIPGTLAVTGNATLSGNANLVGGVAIDTGAANAGAIASSNALRFGSTSSGEGVASKRTASGNVFGLDFYTAGFQRISITNGGGVQIPGSTATNPGTAITASYGATYNINFGSLTVGTPGTSSQTLTGVATGGVCTVSVDANIGPNDISCYVSASNTVIVKANPTSNNTLGAGNYRVRVWQP